MSSTLYVNVSTEPMAESVQQVANHVNGTTVAIVAMKAATVAAEQSAANHICENVNRGFFSLVLSQLSQRSAEARAVVDAKLQELSHFGAALRRVHEQMDRDFHRISNRYTKVFQTLNNSLKTRVSELDKASVELSAVQMHLSMRRMLNEGVQTPVHQKESICASQAIASSVARRTALKALENMSGILDKTAALQESMMQIIDGESPESSVAVMIPAVLFESDDINMDIKSKAVYAPAFSVSKNIESALLPEFGRLDSSGNGEIAEAVIEQARAMLAAGSLPERVSKTTLELISACAEQKQGLA